MDGALSNNLPFAESPCVITVSPFTGTVDICPESTSASMFELNAFNASFQVSTMNFFLGITSLLTPYPEVGLAVSSLEGMRASAMIQGPVRQTPNPPHSLRAVRTQVLCLTAKLPSPLPGAQAVPSAPFPSPSAL